MRSLPPILCIAALLPLALATQTCVSIIEARSNPLYPPGHGSPASLTCVDDAATARRVLRKRLEARCATRSASTRVSTTASAGMGGATRPPRVPALLTEVVTALSLLGLPLAIGFTELAYTSSCTTSARTRSAPYTAFVLLTCALHLVVVIALYGGRSGESESVGTAAGECCAQGARFLLRQPLCGGGALIARVAPPVPPLRLAVARDVALFAACAWAACAVSVLRARGHGVREAQPLLAKRSAR